jgi:hypothetical protein
MWKQVLLGNYEMQDFYVNNCLFQIATWEIIEFLVTAHLELKLSRWGVNLLWMNQRLLSLIFQLFCLIDKYLFDSEYEILFTFSLPLLQQPSSGLDRLIVEFIYHTHTHTHTHRQTDRQTERDSSERLTSSSQRPLPTQLTTFSRGSHPCPQRDSNPQSHQLSGCWPKPRNVFWNKLA